MDCEQLAVRFRELATTTYAQQLRTRLANIKDLPAGLKERVAEALGRNQLLAVIGSESVVLLGGQRFFQRDATSAVNAVQFACHKNLFSEDPAITVILAATYRDLTIAAFDAAENDAGLILVRLHASVANASTDLGDDKNKQSLELGRGGTGSPAVPKRRGRRAGRRANVLSSKAPPT
jgi:hypothetical protein